MMKINDFESLLLPITPDNPAGINLEYEPIFDKIIQARKSDDENNGYISLDEWSLAEPHTADWNAVRSLCETGLTAQGKDLQVACWYIEALTHLDGLNGIEQGLIFLQKFLNQFWLQCWPASGEEEFSYRTAILSRLDRDISKFLYLFPLLEKETASLADWHRVQAFEHRLAVHPEMRDELIAQEGDLTLETFNKAFELTSLAYLRQRSEQVGNILTQCMEAEQEYLTLSQEYGAHPFSQTQNTLNEIKLFLQRRDGDATQKNPADAPQRAVDAISDAVHKPEHAVMTRAAAIQHLQTIASFFRETEPSSPVPFLLARAVRWANMPLTEWLDEVLANNGSLSDIHALLQGKAPSCPKE